MCECEFDEFLKVLNCLGEILGCYCCWVEFWCGLLVGFGGLLVVGGVWIVVK